MNNEQAVMGQVRLAFVVSLCLLGFVLLTPNAANEPAWAFFRVARATTWGNFFNWPAAWCSLKIILVCVALFMFLDALGTLLVKWNQKSLAYFVFWSIGAPSLGFFIGGYYLLKSLF